MSIVNVLPSFASRANCSVIALSNFGCRRLNIIFDIEQSCQKRCNLYAIQNSKMQFETIILVFINFKLISGDLMLLQNVNQKSLNLVHHITSTRPFEAKFSNILDLYINFKRFCELLQYVIDLYFRITLVNYLLWKIWAQFVFIYFAIIRFIIDC